MPAPIPDCLQKINQTTSKYFYMADIERYTVSVVRLDAALY